MKYAPRSQGSAGTFAALKAPGPDLRRKASTAAHPSPSEMTVMLARAIDPIGIGDAPMPHDRAWHRIVECSLRAAAAALEPLLSGAGSLRCPQRVQACAHPVPRLAAHPAACHHTCRRGLSETGRDPASVSAAGRNAANALGGMTRRRALTRSRLSEGLPLVGMPRQPTSDPRDRFRARPASREELMLDR